MSGSDDTVFITEALMSEMQKFQKHVQNQSQEAVCSCIYQIDPEGVAEPIFRISAEPVIGIEGASWYLFDGYLIALLTFDARLSKVASAVFWLRDIDTLIVQAWPMSDFDSEMGTAQGLLLVGKAVHLTPTSIVTGLR